MPVTFGPGAWRVRRVKDLVIAHHWINEECAFAIWPARKRPGGGAFVVCESAIPKYMKPEYMAEQVMTAIKVMCVDQTRFMAHQIRDCIEQGISDIQRMPPDPLLYKRERDKPIEIKRNAGELKVSGEIIVPGNQ
jgi:hypothetical protein